MARIDTIEGQAQWHPGGTEEDSRFREGNRHLRLAYNDEEEGTDLFQTTGRAATLKAAYQTCYLTQP